MAHRDSRGASRRLAVPAFVGVVGLTLIGIGQAVPNRHSIENDLTARSARALQAAGLPGLTVSFSGRDATISGTGPAELGHRAEHVVSTVAGVRTANAELARSAAAPESGPAPAAEPATGETPTPAPTSPPAVVPVGFTLVDGTITITGTVRSEATRSTLTDAARAAGKSWKIVDRLTVDSSLATSATPQPKRFPAIGRLLATAPVDGAKLVIQYAGPTVILRGTPATAGAERALLTAAAATVGSTTAVKDGLDVPTS